jgi:hypothetical protein
MKNKYLVILAICFFISLVFLSANQGQKPQWKGTIEEEDGVTVVKNPKEPMYGELILDLEEDLCIGREDDENYQFYRASALAVDSEDNIYVADAGNSRIQKFNKNGNYILTIGRKGQGPGEFELPTDLEIDVTTGHIYVVDRNDLYVLGGRRIQIFSSSGEYLKGFALEHSISQFFLDTDGFIFSVFSLRDEEGRKTKIVKLNSEGKLIKECAEFSDQKSVQIKSGEASGSFRAIHAYTPGLLLTAIDEQTFVYTQTLRYEIFVIDNNCNVILKIQGDEKPQSITRSEKNHIIGQLEEHLSRRGSKWPKGVIEEACDFPSSRPFFRGITTDDLQRSYLWRVKLVLDKSEEQVFDVYSKDGYFIHRIRMGFLPELIKDGHLYDIDENEDTGEVFIIRYKIKNWSEIKTGIN